MTETAAALKEWGAVVHALLDGRQRVLLRKGGIGEKRSAQVDRDGLVLSVHVHVAERLIAGEVEIDRHRPLFQVELALNQGPFLQS